MDENDQVRQLQRRVEQLEQLCFDMATLILDNVSSAQDRGLFGGKNKEQQKEVDDGVSVERIQDFVNKILANKHTNIGWIPDFVEQKLDKRILLLVMGALSELLKTFSIEAGGLGKLTFDLKPQEVSATDESESYDQTPKKQKPTKPIDDLIKKVLKEYLETVKINLISHQLQPKLQ